MRAPHVVTAVALVFTTAPAYAQSGAAAPASCDRPHAAGVSSERLVSGERPRAYRLFVPPGYDGRVRLPLVLDLHGSGGSAAGQAGNSGLEALGARERFLVATLEAEDALWNVPVRSGRADDVAYARDVIAHAAAQVCTDETRVYATGFSGGGRMTSLLGCRLGSRIAAIAPVAGLRLPASSCDGRPVPVLTFHGLADPQNTYDGHAPGRGAEWLESVPEALAGWARHNGCAGDARLDDPPGPLSTLRYEGCRDGADVRLIRIDGLGHTWPRREVDATGEMWQFFMRHRLGRSPTSRLP
jgi:polyhydroxybutyrate depolymerase